ncbi:LATS, large tumor suppressor [Rhizoctonia solani]|uniref:non-specific serine/threonine protein kinase n=1 Tax=Rhizoctonia solani TaxID=456999 RepID=A0A0K6GEL8_9AGAM|nr:LATS, large tumor suppressor [Rhizoctonia solani]
MEFTPAITMPSSSRVAYAQPSRLPYPTSNVAPAMASPITVNSHRNSTLVHRGFYDLLSLVPGTAGVGVGTRRGKLNNMWPYDDLVAGQRYENIPAGRPAPAPPPGGTYTRAAGAPTRAQEPTSPKGKRRISKDMVSHPMGFVHLVHASDADQAEALLSRWGPDGIGKLGNPNWAQPIKTRIRTRQQERAVAEVMHAMDATPSTSSAGAPVLRVVNGMSVSTLTTSTMAASTPGVEKNSRLASNSRLGLSPPLETQHEHSGEGSTDARVGHGSDSSEVTIKGRSIVPAPPKQAQATISPDLGQVEMVASPLVRREGVGIGYPIGPRSPGNPPQPRSPGRIAVPARSPDRPAGPRSPNSIPTSYSPTQPIPYSATQQATPRTPPQPTPRFPATPPKPEFAPATPPKDFAPATPPKRADMGYPISPKRETPVSPKREFQPVTLPLKRSNSRPLPIPAGGMIGAPEDPLAMFANELLRGVNGGARPVPIPGVPASPPKAGLPGSPGTPGTVWIHPEGMPLPAPSPGAWGANAIKEDAETNSSGKGSGGIGVPRGFTNSIIGGTGDKWFPGVESRSKPFRPSLTTLDKAVSAKIYFENVYFPLLRLPPSREQRRLAMEAEMEQLNIPQHTRAQLRARWRANETAYLRERRRRVDQRSFVKLKTIGHGAFGVVSLVEEKDTGELYAMKQMRKVDMLRKGQEGHVRAERDVLKGAALVSSPTGADWIVRLFYSFQDQDHLYLVLEFMGGGDLLNLLIEKDIFEEDFAKFYIAEMVLAIEQCHKQGFIHRDIKPDNFLFDPNGHIKLSDFGLATDLHWAHDTSYYEQQRRDLLHKHGIDLEDGETRGHKNARRMDKSEAERAMGGEGLFTWREKNRKKLAYSVCGTNSYMSPEVIRGQGYSFSCDWWSLGVIMFECLYGYPPFVSNSRHVTRQKILNWRTSLRFPPRPKISREGVDLMARLLCEPEDRIGAQGGLPTAMNRRSGFLGGSLDGAADIKAHPWFKDIDFARIHEQEAPFKPELQRPDDTKHFDTDIAPEPLAPANGAPPDATKDPMLRHKVHGAHILETRKAFAFAGFTHKSPRKISYTTIDAILKPFEDNQAQRFPVAHGGDNEQRGLSTLREGTVRRARAISM